MENASIEESFERIKKGLTGTIEPMVLLADSLIDIARANNLDVDSPNFKHNWTMASYAKKKRTRIKYAGKVSKTK